MQNHEEVCAGFKLVQLITTGLKGSKGTSLFGNESTGRITYICKTCLAHLWFK